MLHLVAMMAMANQGQVNPAIEKAMSSSKAAIEVSLNDLRRPTFHFVAPANWMNDPNGPFYFNGWYHLFYQYNPYGDQWGHMHWGHARSRNLIDWEHLPVALWPSTERGEEHVFSGSTFVTRSGEPRIFYTSIGNRAPEQWMAKPADPELLRWVKLDQPALTEALHGTVDVREWRDPFLFKEGAHTYMLCGGNIDGKGGVFLYRAMDESLASWKFMGPMFQHPDAENVECPNIAKLGDKWLLLVSVHGHVDAFVGTFDSLTGKFTSDRSSILADGSYASQLLRDPNGRLIHLAWVNTSEHMGWNGWITLPSVLSIAADGALRRVPIAALDHLRERPTTFTDLSLEHPVDLTGRVPADHLEADFEIELGSSQKVELQIGRVSVTYDVSTSQLASSASPSAAVHPQGPLRLRIYVDGSAFDVYAEEGRASLSGRIAASAKAEKVTISGKGAKVRSATFYRMKGAGATLDNFR
jgi:beta-fructofuranosidase